MKFSIRDVLMWAVWTVQQYAKMVSREGARTKYGQFVKDVMLYLADGKHPNLALHRFMWTEKKRL